MNINEIISGNVSKQDLQDISNWVNHYINSFSDTDPSCQENYDIKKHHTLRVRNEIKFLGETLGLTNDALRLAEIIGLLHDIGRFEQYARYKTYKDSNSEDHAALGIKVIHDHAVLDNVEDLSKSIILNSIKYHNRLAIPKTENNPALFFEKLIRDADKLDIWRVVIGYYYRKNGSVNKEIEWAYPSSSRMSKAVKEDLKKYQAVRIEHLQNKYDFILLQMGWVYDLNFEISRKLVSERQYLQKLRNLLPKTEEFDEVCTHIIKELERVS